MPLPLPLIVAGGVLLAPLALLLLLLLVPPQVPAKLDAVPGVGAVYLNVLRAAVRKGKAPKKLTGHKAVSVAVARPVRFDAARYAGFARLVGFEGGAPKEAPIM